MNNMHRILLLAVSTVIGCMANDDAQWQKFGDLEKKIAAQEEVIASVKKRMEDLGTKCIEFKKNELRKKYWATYSPGQNEIDEIVKRLDQDFNDFEKNFMNNIKEGKEIEGMLKGAFLKYLDKISFDGSCLFTMYKFYSIYYRIECLLLVRLLNQWEACVAESINVLEKIIS